MNEYTYEIWSKHLSGGYEFFKLKACKAIDSTKALEIADEDARSCVMQGIFTYQVRNLRKL